MSTHNRLRKTIIDNSRTVESNHNWLYKYKIKYQNYTNGWTILIGRVFVVSKNRQIPLTPVVVAPQIPNFNIALHSLEAKNLMKFWRIHVLLTDCSIFISAWPFVHVASSRSRKACLSKPNKIFRMNHRHSSPIGFTCYSFLLRTFLGHNGQSSKTKN